MPHPRERHKVRANRAAVRTGSRTVKQQSVTASSARAAARRTPSVRYKSRSRRTA